MRLIAIVVAGALAATLAVPAGGPASAKRGRGAQVVCVSGSGPSRDYKRRPTRCTFHRRGEPFAEAFFVRTRHDRWRKWGRSHARGRGKERAPMGHSTQRVRIRLSDPVHKCGHRVFAKAHFFFPRSGNGSTMKLDVCA
jgi:hypothetical protein